MKWNLFQVCKVTRYVQNLYKENYKTLMTKKNQLNNWRNSMFINRKTQYCNGITVSKIGPSFLLKSNSVKIRVSTEFFKNLDKLILKI